MFEEELNVLEDDSRLYIENIHESVWNILFREEFLRTQLESN